MAHLSENCSSLTISINNSDNLQKIYSQTNNFSDVLILVLPDAKKNDYGSPLIGIEKICKKIAEKLGDNATYIIIGEPIDLVHITQALSSNCRYQAWIALKRQSIIFSDENALPHYHFGALIFSKYNSSLKHTKTRIQYTYCPHCDRTTKDYGGKKHTYHEFGTLMSDVWRDESWELDGDLNPLYKRFADLFGIDLYNNLLVIDLRKRVFSRKAIKNQPETQRHAFTKHNNERIDDTNLCNTLILGNSLERLKEIPDNSIDFIFTDPPYNLNKKYIGYSDDLAIKEYFEWCDCWLNELARILKEGRTCAVVNIPLWAVRHFIHLETKLTFQNWIVWDALSFPVRLIMPAHYAIICFSKGKSRDLPGLVNNKKDDQYFVYQIPFKPIQPLQENYCTRTNCVDERTKGLINDRGPLTDLWWDIHRLKHNVRRVDHPCQLPPQLTMRLISIFSKPGECVLDCFNGAGTTTLSAHLLKRKYIGIEISETYHNLAISRHKELENGINPFRNVERVLTAKNSPVPRMKKQKYRISKKTLQLEVKRIYQDLGHIPNRDEVIKFGKYPIKFYDDYFVSWGEVCAAARTTGMTEFKRERKIDIKQLKLNLD